MEPDQEPSRPLSILLVEDNPRDEVLARKALGRTGILYDLQVVSTGELALAYLRREPPFENEQSPDLVLLDLQLPGMSGIEVLQRLKADAGTRAVPIVVLSGSSGQADIARAYAEHANGYISKPLDITELVAALRSVGAYWFQAMRRPSESPPPDWMAAPAPTHGSATGPDLRLLLLDENPDDADELKASIQKTVEEVCVQHVVTPQQALAALEQHTYDAVLVGMQAPDNAGRTLLQTVLSHSVATPVIALTCHASTSPALLQAGAADVLVKGRCAGRDILRAVEFARERAQRTTQQLATQRALAISQLAGGVAHDLANLFQVIVGNLKLIDPHQLEPEVAETLRDVEAAAEQGRHLSRDVQNLAHHRITDRKRFELPSLLQRVARLVRSSFPQLEISLHVAPEAPHLMGAPGLVEQAFLNFVLNAAEATEGQGKVAISVLPSARGVSVVVEDDGPGVPEELLARVTEPYVSTKSGGSGLGLAMAQGIIVRHRGRLRLDSKPGEGLTISVWFPSMVESPATAEDV